MSQQQVKEILTIATLRKLIASSHLITENILLGKRLLIGLGSLIQHFPIEELVHSLYLTKNGLMQKDHYSEFPVETSNLGSLIYEYTLKYHHLNKILQKLEEQ